MKLFILLFGFVLFVCSSFLHTKIDGNSTLDDDNNWKLRKDKNGIKVYTTDQNNSGILEYKAIMTIEADIEQLIIIINDVAKYPSWMANCKVAEKYTTISDSSRIEYMTTSVPWPLNDRDVAFEFVIINRTNDYFEARLKAIPDALPEKEKYIRIRNSEGSWIFNKVDKSKVEIIHQFYGDPEGNMPDWIVNMFIVGGPYKTLLNLKNLCNPVKKE